ncbi:MAG: hypothetical protein ACLFUU_04365 [Desulfobacteraceae bacterium]
MVHTRRRHQAKVEGRHADSGLEAFSPLIRVRSRRRDRFFAKILLARFSILAKFSHYPWSNFGGADQSQSLCNYSQSAPRCT